MATVARLVYHIPSTGNYTIDLARALSVTQRKLHRQKMTYTVLSGQVKESNGCAMAFLTAPHTWTTNVAIRRSFNMWRKANRDLYKKFPGLKAPKYSDFKLYLDARHKGDGAGRNLVPLLSVLNENGSDAVPYQMGEWNYSTLVQAKYIDPDNDGGLEIDDNADAWEMHIVGPHVGSGQLTTDEGDSYYSNYSTVGVIRSWYDSRNRPFQAEPQNMPDHTDASKPGSRLDPLSNIFDIQDDDNEFVEVVEAENDEKPYDVDRVPGMEGNELQLVAYVDNTAGEPDIVNVPGFKAPCGLIRVSPTTNNGAILMLDVLVEGERI